MMRQLDADGRSADDPAHAADPLSSFMAEVVDLARSVDPTLAKLLDPAQGQRPPARPWSGGRRRGLDLCLRMLRYARMEMRSSDDDWRLDLAVGYAEAELAKAAREGKAGSASDQ